MIIKTFWFIAIFLFGCAIYLIKFGGDPAGSVVLDYRFWGLIALGTLSAVVGNILRASHAPEPEEDLESAPGVRGHAHQ